MIFKKSDDQKAVQRDIDAATKNRARLAAQLTEFEQAVTRHEAAAKQAARQGDDAELDRAEAALRASQDRTRSLTAALADVDKELADLECKKADICGSQGPGSNRCRDRATGSHNAGGWHCIRPGCEGARGKHAQGRADCV